MRFKLGLLQDSVSQEKQAKREAAEAQAARHKQEAPTVKTEAQTLADEKEAAKEKEREERGEKKTKESTKPKVKIRPLSEAKAIDSGANFVSETFLLLVGVALILGENWRQNRKQKSRREDVSDRIGELEDYEKSARKGLVELEKEILRLREEDRKQGPKQGRLLPPEVYELEEREEKERHPPEKQGWLEWIRSNTIGDTVREAPKAHSTSNLKSTSGARSRSEEGETSPSLSMSTETFGRLLSSPKETNQSPKSSQSSMEDVDGAVGVSLAKKGHAGDVKSNVR